MGTFHTLGSGLRKGPAICKSPIPDGDLQIAGPFRTLTLLLLATLLLATLALAGCKQPEKPLEFITQPVKRGALEQLVTATGTLSAVVSVDVGSQISGTIHLINADFNSPVSKGQVVAEIDPRTYQAAVHQAQGDLANAQATLELKQLNLRRKQELFKQAASTQADLDTATSEAKQAEAQVTIKEAQLEKAQADLDYCKITAPVDGIVIARQVDVGQTVAASFNTPVLFTIAQDITKMHIDAAISEADIGQVALGQKVNFSVDAFPDETFEGRVSQVRMSPTTTENVVTYSTIIDVDNPDKKLFPGMTAEVSVYVAQRQDVLLVPNAALRFTPPEDAKYAGAPQEASSEEKPRRKRGDGGELPKSQSRSQRTLYVAAEGNTIKPVTVRVGITDGTRSEIIEGLAEGDRVVTASKGGKTTASAGGPPRGAFGGGGGRRL
jgi:HlyD family secretion protein